MDVLYVSRDNVPRIHTKDLKHPHDFDPQDFFRQYEEYLVNIAIKSDNNVVQKCQLKFRWQGDWETSQMEWVGSL